MKIAPIRLNSRGQPPSDPRDFPALWTPTQTHIWRKCNINVPASMSEERVQASADKVRAEYGEVLERMGYEVLRLDGPMVDKDFAVQATTDPDQRAYCMWAKVRRRPAEIRVSVPDEQVPAMQAAGLKLVE